MADRLERIFGTEEDKVNCPFYYKIGACRHGDTCTRLHNKPPLSQTMVFNHIYENPSSAIALADGRDVPKEDRVAAVDHFHDFFEEVFMELAKFGEIEDVVIADNIGDHMIGNMYAKFQSEEQAEKAMAGLNGRFYCGRPIIAEYSPVTDFRESKCRQYSEGQCERGGFCNFMHPKHIDRDLKKQLYKWLYDEYPDYQKARQERREQGLDAPQKRSRSKSPRERRPTRDRQDRGDRRGRDRSRDRDRDRERVDRDRDHDRERDYRKRRDRDGDRHRVDRGDRGDKDRERYERPRERDFDRDGKRSSRRERSRSRDKEQRVNRNPESQGHRMIRMTSEERRKMIAGFEMDQADTGAGQGKAQHNSPRRNPEVEASSATKAHGLAAPDEYRQPRPIQDQEESKDARPYRSPPREPYH